MLKLVYDIKSDLVPDEMARSIVQGYLSMFHDYAKVDRVYEFCQEIVLNEFRIAVAKGEIAPNDIVIDFNGLEITINRDGSLSEWPKGFCDTIVEQLSELLDHIGRNHG